MMKKMINSSEQWIYLLKELFLNPEGSHFKRMGSGLWLFFYLVLKASPTGFLLKSYQEISKETGIKAKTIRNWMGSLKNKGYISTRRKNKKLLVYVKKWETFKKQVASAIESAQDRAFANRVSAQIKPDTLSSLPKSGRREKQILKKMLYLKDRMNKKNFPNIYNVNKNNINSVNVNKYKLNERFIPSTKEELLALDLAKSLNDTKNFAFYISISKEYPEGLLRRILSEVEEIPLNKIRRSKGAYFCYLLKRYLASKSNSS